MGKLHELLAVEPELKAQAQRELGRVSQLFKSGTERFLGLIRTYTPTQVDGVQLPLERSMLATTVMNELDELAQSFSALLDATVQKEMTNTTAFADVKVADNIIFEGLSATSLLAMEARLAELRKVLAGIPTLDPAVDWNLDNSTGHYTSRRTAIRTEKTQEVIIKYDATKEHPAQTELITLDKIAGHWDSVIQCGMIKEVEKNKILCKLDELICAIKEGRMRANCADVIDVHVGRAIFDYILRE